MRLHDTRSPVSVSGSGWRAPLLSSISRPLKRLGGRTSPFPAHLRVTGSDLDDDSQEYIRRKLGMKLAKFAQSIERVTVRVRDANGPKGGVDQECDVKLVLSGLPSIVIKRRHALLQAAIDEALRATEHAVRSVLQRRRLKPLHGRRNRRARSMPETST